MTTATQQAYIDLIVPGAQRAARDYPGVYASVCIAQAILETGWGKNAFHNNHHGIKWFGNPNGPFPQHVTGARPSRTVERPDSGEYPTEALFRTYADPIGSCLDYAANLKATSAYGKAGAWEARSADEFIRRIGPVYTGGDSSYAGEVLSLMDSHNLRNYDVPGGNMSVTIPNIRENDPKVKIVTQSRTGWGCVCMQITLPLVEAEMKRRGLIKNNIDYFQLGYNRGGVAASAGTHDGGGVVDVAQGITREQRAVWAEFGWMMAPRTREWGWTGGAHGHGVLHGCVHRSAGAATQIRSMMAGRNGLVSNTVTNWVKPSRTWQDAVRALAPAPAAAKTEVKAASSTLTNFLDPWPVIYQIDAANPADVTIYGISDGDLRDRLIAHGFTFYDQGNLHAEMRYGVADILAGWALENRAWDTAEINQRLLDYVIGNPPDLTWVELRPVFDAGHAGGLAFGRWGEQRTKHSVRALQEGLNHFSGGDYLPVDGVYGPTTRQAVANWQVAMRGATAGTPAADGIPGVSDYLHLVNGCIAKTGRIHRARFLL